MEMVTRKLARRIKDLRIIKNLSQEKLAEKAGVHPTYIGKIERAEMNPSIVFLDKIAKAFSLSLSEFLTFPDDKHIMNAETQDIDSLIRFLQDALGLAKKYKTGMKKKV